jgi:hypothetical protein
MGFGKLSRLRFVIGRHVYGHHVYIGYIGAVTLTRGMAVALRGVPKIGEVGLHVRG